MTDYDIDQVSVIIPSYNRFETLINTIKSIQKQTYNNIEIIVVNDCSTEKEYYLYDWVDVKIINLSHNTKEVFGFACAGYVRNKGIENATGKYIAFCDDDDIWFPEKIELQIHEIKKSNCKMCCTEGLIGNGLYDPLLEYKKYNTEYYFQILKNIFKQKGSNLIEKGFPLIWNYEFLRIHNCVITSSVMVEKEILDKIGNFKKVRNTLEDYDCWLRILKHTNCIYLSIPLIYYDNNHGDGRNY